MPKITRQSMKPARKVAKGSEFLQRIKPVSEIPKKGIKLSIYGRGKTGKTRFACTFPKPVLILGFEDESSTLSLGPVDDVEFVQIFHTSEIGEAVELLKEGRFQTVILDHGGGLQDIVLKEVLGLEDIPVQKTWGIAKQADWGTIGIQTKERMRSLLDLASSHSINVVIIAHERNFKEGESDSDVMFPIVGSAMTPTATNWLNGAVDYIAQCYIREQEKTVVKSVGGKKVSMVEKTGAKEFCLRIGPHPVFMTGFRVPPGVELPDSIVDPSYNKIMALIEG